MMLYLYAFVPRSATAPDVPGVGGRPTALVPLGAVSALVGEVDGAIEPEEENVLAHSRVVDALADSNDAVLPVRFGRGFRDLDDLEATAGRLARDIEERLEEVRGCVEIGLHVVAPAQPAQTDGSGLDYMQRRLRDLSLAEALADEIHAPLAEHARAATRTRSVGATALLRAAYLVPRDDVAWFKALVERAQRQRADLSFACTGPWPPYSFAALEPDGAAA
jgi:hypothetical protein